MYCRIISLNISQLYMENLQHYFRKRYPNLQVCPSVTHMLPKKGDLKDPKNYRPITCLPSIYKILSGVHTKYVSNYIVNKQARNKLRNVSIAWIDYKRNYDSVPHTRLIKVMDMHDIAPQIINLIRFLVNTYRITLLMKTIKGIIRSGCINIKRGIF